jgi:tetratricopeptide (TPR) repeat protein
MSACAPSTEALIAAARALIRAGQWGPGAGLLASAGGDHPRVLLARAELAVDQDFWLGTRDAPDALARATAAVARTTDPGYAWEVDLLTTCHAYFSTILGPDGEIRIGPGRHDPATVAELTARAQRVHTTAPPGGRAGWAGFWRGVIADNVAGDPAAARPLYTEALAVAEGCGDDCLAAEALRHLGAHARRRGDHERARQSWERSARLRQRAGSVPGALSQQLALAQNAADTGDAARAATIAVEVDGWAESLRLARLSSQARRLLEQLSRQPAG